MLNEKISLLELIRENIKDGELPDTFSLPKESDDDPSKLRWADGALDGCRIYHMAPSEINEEQMKIVADAFAMLGDNEKAMSRMKDFFTQISPIAGIDAIQNYIYEHTDTLDGKSIYLLAADCLYSYDVDLVKLGIMLVEVFDEPDDMVKDIIRTLGLSDEFSIFVIFNMMTWENGNQEIFELAKKVHSWGRIHAVERLEPENQEIKDWLLANGIDNEVLKEYSALEVYNKVGVAELLKTEINDEKLDQITRVLSSMITEGPVRGISALSENDVNAVLRDYISQLEKHKLTLDICELILTICEYDRFIDFKSVCTNILNSSECKILIEHELENGRAISLAKATDIPYKEKIIAHMKADFDEGFGNCSVLLEDEKYRQQVIDIFRNNLPLSTMIGEPTTAFGYYEEYSDYNKLAYLIQFLGEYPLCGTDLVISALNMPIVQCRTQAIKAISEWCKVNECTLSELSVDIYKAVENIKRIEVDDRVKKMIEENKF